jgi:stage III sporulation protein AH
VSIKTKRIIALSICLLLLAAAIFQNIRNNAKLAGKDNENDDGNVLVNDGNDNNDDENTNTTDGSDEAKEFFAGARLERESDRSLSEAECLAVISDTEASEDEKTAATQMQLAIEMMNQMENTIETAIKSRGYNDVFVILDSDGFIKITVMAKELTEGEVETLTDIALENTDADIGQLVINNII